MKKANENAVKIYENRDKFIVGESYAYKDVCSICDIKEYSGGKGRNLQLNIFKQLFELEEYKVRRTTMYKIISAKKLSEEEVTQLILDKRGTNPNSHNNKVGYRKSYDGLNIPISMFDSKGIYGIFLNEEAYIGKTESGFRNRFIGHKGNYTKTMPHTQDLLQRGGELIPLHIMNDIEDTELILMTESMFIEMYSKLGCTMLNEISGYKQSHQR